MKVTPQSRISTSKVQAKKPQASRTFGAYLSTTQEHAEHAVSEHDNLADQDTSPPSTHALLEQASVLLQRALQQFEHEQHPAPDTLQNIQDICQQLEQLSQSHSHPALTQAQTILSVEAQRIKTMKY